MKLAEPFFQEVPSLRVGIITNTGTPVATLTAMAVTAAQSAHAVYMLYKTLCWYLLKKVDQFNPKTYLSRPKRPGD